MFQRTLKHYGQLKHVSSKKVTARGYNNGAVCYAVARPKRHYRLLLDVPLDTFHGVVVEAEVVADLVDHDVEDEVGHRRLVLAVLLDWPLIDVDRVGQHVAVAGVAAGDVDAAVEAV